MAKSSSVYSKVCSWVIKNSIYALVFLIPIFFLPFTLDTLDFNKQAVLITLSFVALFAWMILSLISSKFEINITPLHIVVGVTFLIYILSTIFSVNRYGSFWGWPQVSSESLITIISLVAVYFVISNVFAKKNIFSLLMTLSVTGLIAQAFGILQLLGIFILPFDFTKTIGFNTVGTVASLGLFTAILMPLAIVLLILSKGRLKILFAVQLALSALILFVINYYIVWWAVIIGCAFTIVFGLLKRDLFDARWMALPMFFLTIAVFFVILNPQINWPAQKPDEVFFKQNTNLQISIQSLKERPIFGSGPGTFAYNFLKFKNPEWNKSVLWNVVFDRGSSKVLENIATGGILGLLCTFALMIFPTFLGAKFLISKKESSDKETSHIYWMLTVGLTGALVVCGFTYLLYASNLVIDFVFFVLIASIVVISSESKQNYVLKSSSLSALVVTFVFTLIFIFGLGLLLLNGQRYFAETKYLNALIDYQKGQKDSGVQKLESAASSNSASDLYFRQLAQAYLLRLQENVSNAKATVSDQDKEAAQSLMAYSINASKIATDLNPNNVTNWSVRGYVFQNLLGFIQDAGDWAIKSYDQALTLSPSDPYLFSQKGSVFLTSALRLGQDKAEEKNQLLLQAKEQFEKAVNLNPNYSNALYSLGLTYDSLGQKDKAIEEFTKVQQLNPKATDIQNILNNLKSGLPALQIAAPPVETPPTETIPTDTKKK